MKKLLISLFAALAVFLPETLGAQTGMWEVYPSYATPRKLIDTPEYVYILSNNSLVGLDKTTNEMLAFNSTNRLNDSHISNIWYSPDDALLFVVYTNGMIDLLHDDGRTTNIADLTTTTADYGTINDVAFRDGKAYIALSKGILVIDTRRGVIEQVGLFLNSGNGYARIAATDSKVLTVYDTNGRINIADRNGNFSTNIFRATDNYVYRASNTDVGNIYGLDGDKFLSVGTSRSDLALAVTTIDPKAEDPKCLSKPEKLGPNCFSNRLQPTKNGFVGNTSSTIAYIDRKGNLTAEVNHSVDGLNNATMLMTNRDPDKAETFWLATPDGLSRRNSDGSVVMAIIRPASTTATNVGQFAAASDGRIYFATIRRDNGYGNDLQPDGSKAYFGVIEPNGRIMPVDLNITTKYDIVANPKNPDEIVVSHRNGVTRYNLATKETVLYNTSNTPMTSSLGNTLLVYGCTFDNEGNLWVFHNDFTDGIIYVVPEADWNRGAPKSSWKKTNIGTNENLWHGSTLRFLPHKKGYIIFSGKTTLGGIDLNGTLSENSDDKVYRQKWSIDEDGMSLGGYQSVNMTVDQNGWTWIPYDAGVMVYRDFATFFTSSSEPMRPKVSRDDGTNLADYLLTNVEVYDLSVDANNNKWLATFGSGLYRVSPDGSQILDQFTTDNSDLPSDNVLAVYADPNSNKVYIGTDRGLAVYHSTSTPAASDFDDVYAYPNPVTPDYTGYITITGLMSDSLVKITDSAGRVVHEGRSDGGSLSWNGCDGSGSRVKSGVYFVYASSNAGGSSKAAVTKIVVVN